MPPNWPLKDDRKAHSPVAVIDVMHHLIPFGDFAQAIFIGYLVALLPLQEILLELFVGRQPHSLTKASLSSAVGNGFCGKEPSIWVMPIFSPVAIIRK